MAIATNSDTGETAASVEPSTPRSTLAFLIRRHPRAAAASIVVVLVAIALTLVTTVASPGRQALDDAASCTQWAAATPAQQIGYAHTYINEYGRFANTVSRADAVRARIGKACTRASYLGEADDISVLAAYRHVY